MAGRIDNGAFEHRFALARHDVDLADALDRIPEKLEAQRRVAAVNGENLHDIAPHAELIAVEADVIALILDIDQTADEIVPLDAGIGADGDDHAAVVDGVAQRIDAGDRRHNDDIAPLRQRRRGAVAQLVDLVVDGGVLLNIRVSRWNVGLRLVVIIIGNEIFNGVFGKEFLELRAELGGQRLVVGQHKGRPVDARDDVGHGEGLARTGDAQQRLVMVAAQKPLDQSVDGLRLIAGRLIFGMQLEIHTVSLNR